MNFRFGPAKHIFFSSLPMVTTVVSCMDQPAQPASPPMQTGNVLRFGLVPEKSFRCLEERKSNLRVSPICILLWLEKQHGLGWGFHSVPWRCLESSEARALSSRGESPRISLVLRISWLCRLGKDYGATCQHRLRTESQTWSTHRTSWQHIVLASCEMNSMGCQSRFWPLLTHDRWSA